MQWATCLDIVEVCAGAWVQCEPQETGPQVERRLVAGTHPGAVNQTPSPRVNKVTGYHFPL